MCAVRVSLQLACSAKLTSAVSPLVSTLRVRSLRSFKSQLTHMTDYKQMQRVTRKIKAGTIWQVRGLPASDHSNPPKQQHFVLADFRVPFGGFKSSGWGRELGMQGLEGYLELKVCLFLLVPRFHLQVPQSIHHYYPEEPFEWPIVL